MRQHLIFKPVFNIFQNAEQYIEIRMIKYIMVRRLHSIIYIKIRGIQSPLNAGTASFETISCLSIDTTIFKDTGAKLRAY